MMRNGSMGFLFFVILVCGIDLELTTAEPYEEGAPDFLIQSESKDPILAIPDNVVWASSGSGSGSDDEREDEAKTDEPKVEVKEQGVEANAGKIQDNLKSFEPQVEAKADNREADAESDKSGIDANQSNVGSEDNTHHIEAETHKPPVEAQVSEPDDSEAKKTTNSYSSVPKFKSVSEELKWKFNKARNSLKEAKEYVKLAYLTAAKKHRGTKNENAIKNIITKTEVALVHAGDKMGLDYVHYK